MFKKILTLIIIGCSLNALAQTDALVIDTSGKVGIGTSTPRSMLDVSTYLNGEKLGTVLGRLRCADGSDGYGDGTYVGVRGFDADVPSCKSFALEHAYGGFINSSINFYRGTHHDWGFITFATGQNIERMRIDGQGVVSLATLKALTNEINIGSPLRLHGNPIYFIGGSDNTSRILLSNTPGRFQLDIRGWDGVSIGCVSSKDSQMLNITPDGVGIHTAVPRAIFDVAAELNAFHGGTMLGSVLARLHEGNDVGDGTYLGVRGFATQPQWCKSFAIEHCFGNNINSSIAFYRGGTGDDGSMAFCVGKNQERMRIDCVGRVGIGTNNPAAILDVHATSVDSRKRYAFIDGKTGDVGRFADNRNNPAMSILGGGCIGTEDNFILFSDARIKNKVGISDRKNDLDLLNRLRVTDYRYIDNVAHDSAVKKGFIAQEVEVVFPQAVTRSRQCVPDIFCPADRVQQADGTVTFTIKKEHHLTNGDVVKIITDRGEETDTVTITGAQTFTIKTSATGYKDAFIYGKFVNDFRMVDYDRLYTLNVSATQELSEEVDRLKAENEALKNKLGELQDKVGQIISKLNTGNAAIATTSK